VLFIHDAEGYHLRRDDLVLGPVQHTIHDFVMLDSMADSNAAKAATAQAIQFLVNASRGGEPSMTNDQPAQSL